MVTWQADKNVTSYEINLYDSTGITSQKMVTVDRSLVSTTFTGLSPSTTYTVGVKNVYSKTVTSKQSALATTTTLKLSMSGVILSNVTSTTATLYWSVLPGVVTYEVARDSIPIAAATAALTTTSVAYTFTSLSPGVTYKFAIRATYQDGTKVTLTTDWVEISQQTAIDATAAPTSTVVPVITLP